MKKNAIQIYGNWTEGYAIEIHTLKSECIGYNEYGRPMFNTQRSKMGELVYRLKYKFDKDIIDDIISLIYPFVSEWVKFIDIIGIISIPPSNKKRVFQPVEAIAEELANRLDIRYFRDFLIKNSDTQSKDLDDKTSIENSMKRKKHFNKKVNILLLDDLYKTGASMNEAVRVLKEDINIDKIYVLTLTKTRT